MELMGKAAKYDREIIRELLQGEGEAFFSNSQDIWGGDAPMVKLDGGGIDAMVRCVDQGNPPPHCVSQA